VVRAGRAANDRRRLDDARRRVDHRSWFVTRLGVDYPPRLVPRLGVNDLAGLELWLANQAPELLRRPLVRGSHRPAYQLDQLQVQGRDEQGNVGVDSHAEVKANPVFRSVPAHVRGRKIAKMPAKTDPNRIPWAKCVKVRLCRMMLCRNMNLAPMSSKGNTTRKAGDTAEFIRRSR
jgi:hypothetical protein